MSTLIKQNANNLSNELKRKGANKTKLMSNFLKNVVYVLKVIASLMKVLLLVYGKGKLARGYIYEAIYKAKETVMKCFNTTQAISYELFDDESKSLNNNKKNPLVVKTKLSSLMMKVSNNKLFACKEIEEKIKKGFTKNYLSNLHIIEDDFEESIDILNM